MEIRILVLACCLGLPAVAAAQAPAPPVTVHNDTECEVWARELGFARSVATHDAAAFAAFLHPQAAFNTGHPAPTRGRDAIARDWVDVIAGKGLELSWYPTRVTVGGRGDIAWSSGPALFERPQADPGRRHSIGQYQSVWQRDGDGVWRVVFDHGVGIKPAGEDEVKAFHAGRREDCPRG